MYAQIDVIQHQPDASISQLSNLHPFQEATGVAGDPTHPRQSTMYPSMTFSSLRYRLSRDYQESAEAHKL